MAWQGRIHWRMKEHVSSAIPNYCNKNGGTAVPEMVALDGRSSSEGSPKHNAYTHNNQLGYMGVWRRLRMGIDHLFDP